MGMLGLVEAVQLMRLAHSGARLGFPSIGLIGDLATTGRAVAALGSVEDLSELGNVGDLSGSLQDVVAGKRKEKK